MWRSSAANTIVTWTVENSRGFFAAGGQTDGFSMFNVLTVCQCFRIVVR